MAEFHNEVSGSVEGPVVQVGKNSGGVHIHHSGASRSPARITPFWFDGTAYTDPVELATAMARRWEEGRAVVEDDRRQQLAAWLDMLDDAAVPVNWLSGDISADATLSRLIRHFAPDAKVYLDRFPMDPTGIEDLCRAAEDGDRRAGFLVRRLDDGLLRVVATHSCDHTDCTGVDGCQVLADVATQYALAARKFPEWGVESPLDHYPAHLRPSPSRTRTSATLIRCLLNTAYADLLHGVLARHQEKGLSTKWWRALVDDANSTSPHSRHRRCLMLALALHVGDQDRNLAASQAPRGESLVFAFCTLVPLVISVLIAKGIGADNFAFWLLLPQILALVVTIVTLLRSALAATTSEAQRFRGNWMAAIFSTSSAVLWVFVPQPTLVRILVTLPCAAVCLILLATHAQEHLSDPYTESRPRRQLRQLRAAQAQQRLPTDDTDELQSLRRRHRWLSLP